MRPRQHSRMRARARATAEHVSNVHYLHGGSIRAARRGAGGLLNTSAQALMQPHLVTCPSAELAE